MAGQKALLPGEGAVGGPSRQHTPLAIAGPSQMGSFTCHVRRASCQHNLLLFTQEGSEMILHQAS